MPVNHWKGIPVPAAGDDLLSAWSNAFDAAGVIFPAQSVAAGREILSRAQAAGHPPTAAHPAYLDVSGVLYRADGTKNGDRWVLRPVNEVQTVETPVQLNNALTLKNGQYSDAVTADLGVRPYDRVVQAYFTIWGRVSNGDVDADLRILGRSFRARFPNDATGATVTVVGMCVVPAGQDPKLRAGFSGAYGTGGTFSYVNNKEYSALGAIATPRSMA